MPSATFSVPSGKYCQRSDGQSHEISTPLPSGSSKYRLGNTVVGRAHVGDADGDRALERVAELAPRRIRERRVQQSRVRRHRWLRAPRPRLPHSRPVRCQEVPARDGRCVAPTCPRKRATPFTLAPPGGRGSRRLPAGLSGRSRVSRIGAEDAAIAGLRPQAHPAGRARVEELARVGRDRGSLRRPAGRTCERRLEDHGCARRLGPGLRETPSGHATAHQCERRGEVRRAGRAQRDLARHHTQHGLRVRRGLHWIDQMSIRLLPY